MRWAWLGFQQDQPAGDVLAWAPVFSEDGNHAGFLASWPDSTERPAGAAKVDRRAIDQHGHPGWMSLALVPSSRSVPFDDPAVSQALREVLSLPPAAVFSTLSESDDTLLGSLTAAPEPSARLRVDPFARIFPVRFLRVGPGLLGRSPVLPGPVIQRYGSGSPWPVDEF